MCSWCVSQGFPASAVFIKWKSLYRIVLTGASQWRCCWALPTPSATDSLSSSLHRIWGQLFSEFLSLIAKVALRKRPKMNSSGACHMQFSLIQFFRYIFCFHICSKVKYQSIVKIFQLMTPERGQTQLPFEPAPSDPWLLSVFTAHPSDCELSSPLVPNTYAPCYNNIFCFPIWVISKWSSPWNSAIDILINDSFIHVIHLVMKLPSFHHEWLVCDLLSWSILLCIFFFLKIFMDVKIKDLFVWIQFSCILFCIYCSTNSISSMQGFVLSMFHVLHVDFSQLCILPVVWESYPSFRLVQFLIYYETLIFIPCHVFVFLYQDVMW